MYRIAVLAKSEEAARNFAEQINQFCTERGIFPQMELFRNQEQLFEAARKAEPTSAVIALPGVAGLNAVEHFCSLYPGCGVIWCSDLDFSLHAFRLRVDYFLMEPVSGEALREGLSAWFRRRSEAGAKKNSILRRN